MSELTLPYSPIVQGEFDSVRGRQMSGTLHFIVYSFAMFAYIY